MRRTILAASLAALLLGAQASAQPAPPQPADDAAQASGAASDSETADSGGEDSAASDGAANPRLAQAQKLVDSLHFQSGEIAIAGASAHVHLDSHFRFLDKADTRKVLEELWRNPPDDDVLGLIVPTATPLLDDHAWAVLVTRTDDGHVADADAAKTDYAQMLKDMQQSVSEGNEERTKAGYSAMQLVGWAEAPRYDEASKKLYWARELSFSDATQHTLNYDIRVLGRSGYLSLNAIAGMNDLGTVRNGMQQLLPMVEFDPGNRYADYNSSTDKLAGYGIAALVAGGIAAKAGLFAKIGVILLAAKKLVIAAVVAIGALFRKIFGGKGKGQGPGPTVQ